MKRVALYGRVRHAVIVHDMSRREAARVFWIDRLTVDKLLVFAVPPGYPLQQAPVSPKPGPLPGLLVRRLAAAEYLGEGAGWEEANGTVADSCYVFKRSGTSWAQEARLLASDGATIDNFGNSVSISGDYAVVGGRFDDDNGTDAGSAYIYSGSVLNLPSISLSPNPMPFGDVRVGSSKPLQLSITNSGDAALNVSSITVSNSEFSVASTGFQVAAGATLNKTVTFSPTSTGVKSATLTVNSYASNQSTATVNPR